MRILIYSYNYHPEPIGIAPLMTQLAEGLVQRGHDVRVVTGMPNYPQRRIYPEYRGTFYQTETINGVTVQRSYVWVRPKPGLVTRAMLDGSFVCTSFIQALRGWRPDVIVLTVPPLPVSIPATLLSFLYRCPVILNLQDILPEAAVQVGLLKNKLAIRVFEALERFAYRQATHVSVIADGFVSNLSQKGVPQTKLTCIPNWVDVNEIYPTPFESNQFRIDHQLQNKFVVMYSGNIALTQGMETVVRAATIVKNVRDIVFVIVGENRAIADLQKVCDAHRALNVKLLTFQPREKLPEMLSAANVGLIIQKANVVAFNMPSKTQCLLASGRPIIVSAPLSGTAADAVWKSEGGVIVPPENPMELADAILGLYWDPAKAEILGQKGRMYALKHYSLKSALDRYETLFREVTHTEENDTALKKETISGAKKEAISSSLAFAGATLHRSRRSPLQAIENSR